MNRELFANKLCKIVKRSGIKQDIIAQALGISSAALSQFIHGFAIPGEPLLITLLTTLCASKDEQEDMLILLEEARKEFELNDENPYFVDPENDAADDDDDDIFADDERDSAELPQKTASSFWDQSLLEQLFKDVSDTPSFTFAAPQNCGVPVVNLEDMKFFEDGNDLFDFAHYCTEDTVIRDYGSLGGNVIMVKANGTQLGMSYDGLLIIVVTDNIKATVSTLRLSGYADGTFRLEPHGFAAPDDEKALFGTPAKKTLKRCWSLPVIELNIMPIKGNNNLYGDL